MRANESRGCEPGKAARCAAERGFTLIETSVAMVILMIAGLGVATVFTYSIRYNSGADDRAIAISIAQHQLEQCRSVAFDSSILTPAKIGRAHV